jgi:hypothetical protein
MLRRYLLTPLQSLALLTVRQLRLTRLVQLFVIWLSVEIIVMLTFTQKLPPLTTMALVLLIQCTVLVLEKAMSLVLQRLKR